MSDAGEATGQILSSPLTKGFMGPRRARSACTLCRSRKVRCNAHNGQPCSTCIFENVQCIWMPKQRRQKTAKPSKRPQPSSLPVTAEESRPSSSFPASYSRHPQHQMRQPLSPEEDVVDRTYPNLAQAVTQVRLGDTDDQLTQEFNDDIDWRAAAVKSVPLPISPNPSSSGTFSGLERSSVAYSIPSFLKPIPSYLAKEDVDYLYRKEALSVPEPELRDALIESYVHYIHPCLPILDLGMFTDILGGTSNERISFPLFQAVMFAGAAWVDIKPLRRLGFLTRKAARKAFYLKARLLYDADYEQDRLCLVPTLLLLSLWWESPDEQKDGWHWSGLSLSVARTIGLNRDINSQHLNPKTRALRRRLWWCCTIRDTIASFGTNRPPRVRDSDFEVAPLTLNDFEYQEFNSTDPRGIGTQDMNVQIQLATICIQLAGVCTLIRRVLQAAYTETVLGNIDTLYYNSVPKSQRTDIDPQTLKDIEDGFREWKENVPRDVLHASPTPAPSLKHEQAPLLHRAMVSMLYHTGLIMLHRQRSPASDEEDLDGRSSSLASEKTPRAIVRKAAAQVNTIVMDLYKADLMKYLPATGISCLFPVSISHVLDMKNGDPMLRREGRQRLEECKQAIRELADAHIAAEWAVNFLTYVESQVNAPTRASRKMSETAEGRIQRAGTKRQPEADDMQDRAQDQGVPRDVLNEISVPDIADQIPWTTFEQSAAIGDVSAEIGGLTNPAINMPSGFSDLTNFPEMWLGFNQAQGNMPGIGWLTQDNMNMDFG